MALRHPRANDYMSRCAGRILLKGDNITMMMNTYARSLLVRSVSPSVVSLRSHVSGCVRLTCIDQSACVQWEVMWQHVFFTRANLEGVSDVGKRGLDSQWHSFPATINRIRNCCANAERL
jgi:hypothetical protein